MKTTVYAASHTEDGGIYQLSLDEDGHLSSRSFVHATLPSYMTIAGKKLLALLTQPFAGSDISGLAGFCIRPDGSLVQEGGIYATGGTDACFLSADPTGNVIYCANYTSGSIARIEQNSLKLNIHKGYGPDSVRQASAHVHQVLPTPDHRFICAVDLGLDSVTLYHPDLTYHSKVAMPGGCGPRHMVFSPDGHLAYCLNELASTVTVLRYDGQSLFVLRSYSSLPADAREEPLSQAAAIRMTADGKWLLASNRGHDSIACFRVMPERLALHSVTGCGGCWPRDFILSPDEKYLICANEKSDNIAVFGFSDGRLSEISRSFLMEHPLALLASPLS